MKFLLIVIMVYIFLAEGFEQVEALAPLDIFRRAKLEAYTVSIDNTDFVTSSHNVQIKVDKHFDDFLAEYDKIEDKSNLVLLCPGGLPGAEYLSKKEELISILSKHNKAKAPIAAICAAPSLVLSKIDDVKGIKATCYKGFEKNMQDAGMTYTAADVEVFDNIITGAGAGLAIDFALSILSKLHGQEFSDNIRHSIMLK